MPNPLYQIGLLSASDELCQVIIYCNTFLVSIQYHIIHSIADSKIIGSALTTIRGTDLRLWDRSEGLFFRKWKNIIIYSAWVRQVWDRCDRSSL